jgi:hypothetical protein
VTEKSQYILGWLVGGLFSELADPVEPQTGFSALQVIFLFGKQENVMIRVPICGPQCPRGVAGKSFRIKYLSTIPYLTAFPPGCNRFVIDGVECGQWLTKAA